MTAVDSSVVVAGFATWHTLHEEARRVLDRRPRVVGHAMVESYSVLTRLPAPHRADGSVVVEFLDASFPEEPCSDWRTSTSQATPKRGSWHGMLQRRPHSPCPPIMYVMSSR